jgi:hypothetical protein
MNEPRNVTPGWNDPRDSRDSTAWSWDGRGRGGRDIPWLGVLLVLVGIALLVQYFVPGLSAGTLVLLAIAVALLAGWLIGGASIAMVPALLVLALGVAELIEDLALLGPQREDVPGLAASALAIAFVVMWLIGAARGRRSMWPLWGVAIFGLIGVAQLSGRLVGMPSLSVLWPVLIIIVGVVVLLNARRGRQPPVPPTRV